MQITESLYVHRREDWRRWLEENHASAREIWLISYRLASGIPSIPYNDAVEEALCFGWIDSTRKSVDDVSSAQRYSPRRKGAAFSQPNRERLERMREQGRLAPHIASATQGIRATDFTIADDIIAALDEVPGARSFFEGTSPSYQRIRAAYVDSARSEPETFAKRLTHLVSKCGAGKQFGYGIESYY
jgi:uncharacterized protein YdeI (YjbR/CyaY-like superfamily)